MPEDEAFRRTSAVRPGEAVAMWLPRLMWPLPGMLLGATIGFYLYFRQPGLNTDTAAPLFFAFFWALGGLLAGGLATACAGWAIDLAVRRALTDTPWVAGGVTLACLAGVSLVLHAPVESRLAALLWPARPAVATQPPRPGVTPCKQVPPTDPQLRKTWELECR